MRSTFHPEDLAAAQAFARLLGDCLALEHPDTTIPALAQQLHVSTERLRKWLNPDATTYNMPYYLLTRWDEVVGPRLLQHMNFDTGYRPPAHLEPPTTRAQVLELITTTLLHLATILDAITPYLERHRSHVAQRTIRDATLHIMRAIGGIDQWATEQSAPLPPSSIVALDRRRAA